MTVDTPSRHARVTYTNKTLMETNTDQKKEKRLSSKHLETLSNRIEKVALLLLASLVVQKIVTGEGNDPTILIWLSVSFILYFVSYKLLIKS